MTVPSPNIKPQRIAGGEHALLYVGAVGVSSSIAGLPEYFSEGIVSFYPVDTIPMQMGVGDAWFIAPGAEIISAEGRRYTVTFTSHESGFELCNVVANVAGAEYDLPVGAKLTLAVPQPPFPTPGTVEVAILGGAAAIPPGGALHIDLTEMSFFLRESTNFVEQLQVVVKALDVGIGGVEPYFLQEQDFHRDQSGRIEYVSIQIDSDSEANEAVIKVVLPHTHSR